MYLLGYDIGSSSVKASIIDAASGRTLASDFYPRQEAPIKALRAGWAEQRPDDWWKYLCEVTHSVIASSAVNPSDIAAIGISYQMHGVVCVGRDGRPLRDAIIWCDSRGVPYGGALSYVLGDEALMPHILNRPGNFTATKLAWVKENEPDLFAKIWKVMLPGEYAAFRMTGCALTTVEGLSEWMLWDFATDAPAEIIMDALGFKADILPEIVPTFGPQGNLTPEAAADLGLVPGIPITYRAGDQPNNALSLGVLDPGQVAGTAGTSGVIYGINDSTNYDPQSRVNCFAHVNHSAAAPRIGVMTCVSGTGILNSWMKHNVAPQGMDYAEMNRLAAAAPIGCDGLAVLPFGNGAERILSNADPRCSFHGINFNIHHRQHLLRAAQEGIVFALAYGIEVMKQMGMKVERIHAGRANMFLSPIFRDTLAAVTGASIALYDTDGSVGAARGAGIGAGIYRTPAEAFASLSRLDVILPPADTALYILAYNHWKSLL